MIMNRRSGSMKSLNDMPKWYRETLPPNVKEALAVFTEEELGELKAFINQETGNFDCIGFVGPGGKVTKYANVEKYKALIILEDYIKRGENAS